MTKGPIDHIRSMTHSQLQNYVIPGLTSSLVGAINPETGGVRLFECSRNHHESITPHSHRFDFQCLVLAGRVRNIVWTPTGDSTGDHYGETILAYKGAPGEYERRGGTLQRYETRESIYSTGQWYGMRAHEIHSIYFDRGTSVLFFEGPEVTNQTVILEPFVGGQRVPTFEVKDWMFQR